MDDQTHKDLLVLRLAELRPRTPFCPDDQEMGEYFDCRMAEAGRFALEQHLADCRYCMARVGMLYRQQQEDTDPRIPGDVLATAKQLRPAKSPRRWHPAPAWAAAAVIILTLSLVLHFDRLPRLEPGTGAGITPADAAASSGLRNISRAGTRLDILFPAPEAVVRPGSPIRWSAAPGAVGYDVFILSASGDSLWTGRLQSSEWTMREIADLPAGSEFYFLVEAELPDGSVARSQHLALRAGGQP